MLNDEDFRKILPNLDSVDPIGAIRRRAREMWRSEGSPANVDIKLLFERAETEVLGPARTASPSAPAARNKPRVDQQPVEAELREFLSDPSDTLRSVIIEAIRTRPTEHEAVCLARLLNSNCLILQDQSKIERRTVLQAAELLADIAKEYPADLLEANNVTDYREIDKKVRAAYWNAKLSKIFDEDEALTFSDRLTIMRYVSLLRASSAISDVQFEG